jgi:hypothetical protein
VVAECVRQRTGRSDTGDDLLRRRNHRHWLPTRHYRQRRLQGGTSEFTGEINWVQIDLGGDKQDYIDPDECLCIVKARQ